MYKIKRGVPMPGGHIDATTYPFAEMQPGVPAGDMFEVPIAERSPKNVADSIRYAHARLKSAGLLPEDHTIRCFDLGGGLVGCWRVGAALAAPGKRRQRVSASRAIRTRTTVQDDPPVSQISCDEPEDNLRHNLGRLIITWCKRAGMRSNGLATRIGVEYGQMVRWIDNREPIPVDMLRRIAEEVGARDLGEFMEADV